MKEEYINWYTPHLSRHFEMLVFGHAGKPLIVFPTSQGHYYEVKDFKLIESIRWFVEQGLVRVYCPDAIDAESWYNKGIHPADRVRTHMAYENVIVKEVMHKARVEGNTDKVMMAGASFGGFHALSMAFRHPHLVSNVISMSGASDISMFMNGYYDENCYFVNPVDFVGGVHEGQALHDMRKMGIILQCSEHDNLKEDNFNFHNVLNGKGINHWFDYRHGTRHDWETWRKVLPLYLSKIV